LDTNDLESAAQRIAADILRRIEWRRPADYAEQLRRDPLVAWSNRGVGFLARAFRFIDVYPAARTDGELLDYLAAYVGEPGDFLPGPDAGDAAGAVRGLVRGLQRRFTAGETEQEALDVCARLHQSGLASTLDILGEEVNSEAEAQRYADAYLGLIERACSVMGAWPDQPQADDADYGPVPRLNVSIKLSSLYSRFDPIDQQGSFDVVLPRLREVFRAARRHDAAVSVDMEQYAFKDLTLGIFKSVLMEDEFRDWPHASITIQTYLPGSGAHLKDLAAWAAGRGTPVHVRVVKGAYWDYEVQRARYRNWPVPVYQSKEQTDADFEAACLAVLRRRNQLRPAIAGHNVRSIALAVAAAEQLGLPVNCIEFQTLFGLGDELKAVLAEMGHRTRVYVPFGRLVPGMAYLVRRLLEATSRSAFLRQIWASPLPIPELVRPPKPAPAAAKDQAEAEPRGLDAPFRNEPVSDFSRPEARAAMADALEAVRTRLGKRYPLWIGGKPVETVDKLVTRDPCEASRVVGLVATASRRHAAAAVRAAQKAWPGWASIPSRERAALLLRAAEQMRRRRFELSAWEVFEVGKSWREADADVAEAVDYLEYYAREAVRLSEPRLRPAYGEENAYFYEPLGVAVAITPWNFPLAILTGVTSAAAVAGNCVIVKPAEQSSVIAAQFMEIWNDAGVPPGVVQYLPGRGEVVGDALVRHPGVHVIAFTGSKDVGLRIQKLAAAVRPGQRHVKRVIAEMGGKNAIIVDRDADLDQAVPGVLQSAFGYQGQKCSACSRAVVLREVYGEFLERLVEATRSLPIGPASDPHSSLGPLVDEGARQKVLRYAAVGRQGARVAYEGNPGPFAEEGWYVGPLILADVGPQSAVAQEEIFGPVLCVIPARDFDHAVEIANATPYGLTGGLYSRNPRRVAEVRGRLRAGNVYVNRPITGALVERQPFGGFGLSGIGSKAGGPDYLRQFVQPRSFSEYTVRRGFALPPDSCEPRS